MFRNQDQFACGEFAEATLASSQDQNIELIRKTLAGKWKFQILWQLRMGPQRFNQIRKELGKVSEKVLAQQLKDLVSLGVIHREQSIVEVNTVHYQLSERGKRLTPILGDFLSWTERAELPQPS